MIATYTCEQCFSEYDDEGVFVRCHGDACHEEVCTNCAKKCKNPSCSNHVCENCLSSNKSYCGEYCIKCAMWTEDEDEDSINFDFVARGMTHDEGLAYIKAGEV